MNYELFNNILDIYEYEVRKNTKNKKKIYNFDKYKMQNINNIYNIISWYKGNYVCKYNIFLITRPKFRVVMALNIKYKVINHYVARFILMLKLEKYLDIRNIATRKNMGTDYARKLLLKYIEKHKKYKDFYVLKLDISKYFYSIDHNVLKSLLKDKLDFFEYNLICDIIDSTNYSYINKSIIFLKEKYSNKYLKNSKEINKLPLYEKDKGLPIGNMTSQFLSIFYLYKLDHKIIYDYKVKYYIKYMDDFILIDKDKSKLEKILVLLEKELKEVYKLKLNKNKCKISHIKEGIVFLGYRYRVLNNKTIINLEKSVKKRITKRIKEVRYLYDKDVMSFESVFSSINTYMNSYKHNSWYVRRLINKEWFTYEFKK